jgi:hypothetical protein
MKIGWKNSHHEPIDQCRRHDTGEDNADAHMKRQIMGGEVVVTMTTGKLDFGPWEQIFYGRRCKRPLVKIIGGKKASPALYWEDLAASLGRCSHGRSSKQAH